MDPRLDKMPDCGFADPTEGEARKGDSELGGGDIGIEVVEEIEDTSGALVAFVLQLLHARAADRDQREFSCDEKSVGENKKENGKERYAGTNWVLQTSNSTITPVRILAVCMPTIASG